MKEQNSVTELSHILSRFKKSERKLKVTIIGAFGARNVGDLAIMKTIVNDLERDEHVQYSFASRDEILKNFYKTNITNPFSVAGFMKLLKNDVIVIGGGGLYGHETHRYLIIMLPIIGLLKSLFRKKLLFYNVGIYKAERKFVLGMLWSVLKRADEILLRDDSDVEIIPDNIRVRARVEPDITFLLQAKEPRDQHLINLIQKFDRVVGLSLRYTNVNDMNSPADARIAQTVKEVVCEQFLKRNIPVLFIPYQPIDSAYVKNYFSDVLKEYPDKFFIIDTEKLLVEEIKWIISKLSLAIGMRLHFQIFSNDQNVPLVGLSYAPKCTNFLKKVGCPTIDAYSINYDILMRAIGALNVSLVKSPVSARRKEQDSE